MPTRPSHGGRERPHAAPPDTRRAAAVRGFLIGLVLLVFLATTILSLRPGGLRRQLNFAARRLRIALVLGGVYLVTTAIIRVAFPDGPVTDWGPPLLALALAVLFLVLAQDPVPPQKNRL